MSDQVCLGVPEEFEPVVRAANIEDRLAQALVIGQRSECLPAVAHALEVHLRDYAAEVSALCVRLEQTPHTGKAGQTEA